MPHIPVSDTVKRVENGMVLETVPRSELTILQTPWAFRRETLEGVYPIAFQGGVESAPRLRQGFSGILLDGEPANIKVRTMEDLRLVERLLAATHPADGR
jgi:2-C-methyl-D-erythritol 4-phosphate cytidylyltransferase